MIAIGNYFRKYRNIAFGVTSACVGIGVIVLSPLIQYMEQEYGWRGCVQLMAAIFLHAITAGIVFKPVQSTHKDQVQMNDIEEKARYDLSRHKKLDWAT